MTRLVFGRDVLPAEAGERMADVARASCGHIVAARSVGSIDGTPFEAWVGVPGLDYERVASQVVRDEGFCRCPRPQQQGMSL